MQRMMLLLPNDDKNTNPLQIPTPIMMSDWMKSDDLLALLQKKSPGLTSFTVWQLHHNSPHLAELEASRSPALLEEATYSGMLTGAMGILRFSPVDSCDEVLKETIKDSGVKLMPAHDGDVELLQQSQAALNEAVNYELLTLCARMKDVFCVSQDKTHCHVNFPEEAKKDISYLLFNDERKLDIWQRLNELNLSLNLSSATIYCVERNPDGMGLLLRRLNLTYSRAFKKEITNLLWSRSDNEVNKQNESYLQVKITDLFDSRNKSAEACKQLIESECDVNEMVFPLAFSVNPFELCQKILWQCVTTRPGSASQASNFEKELTHEWSELATCQILAHEEQQRERSDAATAKKLHDSPEMEPVIRPGSPLISEEDSDDDEIMRQAKQQSLQDIAELLPLRQHDPVYDPNFLRREQADRRLDLKTSCELLMSTLEDRKWVVKHLYRNKPSGVAKMISYLTKVLKLAEVPSEKEVLGKLQAIAREHMKDVSTNPDDHSKPAQDANTTAFYGSVIGANALPDILASLEHLPDLRP
tara:strand:+ start:4502 stop:6091 length:1590 start_codon:yes stop_codon:yes gene_type:complete